MDAQATKSPAMVPESGGKAFVPYTGLSVGQYIFASVVIAVLSGLIIEHYKHRLSKRSR